MEQPLVTVFIPVYNAEQYLSEALESMLQQTYKNIEILLVDDGSTDHSVDVINSFHDERIRLIQNEENKGIPYTRNVGLQEAKGKYMVIMDSDDISLPNRIEKQVDFLEKNSDIDAVGTYYLKFGGRWTRKIKSSTFTTPEALQIMLLFFSPIANPSSIVRLQTVKDHGITYNPEHFVAQDYGFWAQLSKVGKLSIIPEYLLKYRSGHENITKKSKRDKQERRKRVINSIHEDLLNHYGIELPEEELDLFNEFFSYNYGSITNFKGLSQMVSKLKQWNEETNTFKHDTFLEVLDDAIMTGITNQKISRKEKIDLYKSLISKPKSRYFMLIWIKHLYHQLQSLR